MEVRTFHDANVVASGESPSTASTRWSWPAVTVSTLVVALTAAACSGGATVPTGASEAATRAGERGLEIAQSSGCAACHGQKFTGGVGPSWVGLYGSDVELNGGAKVTADDAYLFESIRDPEAKKVSGSLGVPMPRNTLSDDDIDAVIEYIKTLSNG